MELVVLAVIGCIGAVLAMYGGFSLGRYRGKRMPLTGRYVLSFVCIFTGVILLGYAFGHIV